SISLTHGRWLEKFSSKLTIKTQQRVRTFALSIVIEDNTRFPHSNRDLHG
ncbi:MAG: hypothetical protein ACI9WR_000718, partial [Paracoccaceae bacterium]